jgi:hypothetical protein
MIACAEAVKEVMIATSGYIDTSKPPFEVSMYPLLVIMEVRRGRMASAAARSGWAGVA